ncbi:hypothetical protein BDV97DRAFT_355278 [Delphinella strobiligena]|nr:hypothetical protein BDV97DRAFT_355278 [Delphinella strobiligena]
MSVPRLTKFMQGLRNRDTAQQADLMLTLYLESGPGDKFDAIVKLIEKLEGTTASQPSLFGGSLVTRMSAAQIEDKKRHDRERKLAEVVARAMAPYINHQTPAYPPQSQLQPSLQYQAAPLQPQPQPPTILKNVRLNTPNASEETSPDSPARFDQAL